jgi:hypothetical protein
MEEDARWALVISTEYREEWLFWSIRLYDGETGFSRILDAFYVSLVAGVSARNAIEASALRVIENWNKISSIIQFDGEFAVSIPQKFAATQEGLEVHYGSEQGPLAGVIEDGTLITELFLFPLDVPVHITLTKKGYWPRSLILPKGITEKEIKLPSLQKKTYHSLGLGATFRVDNNYNYAVNFEYRFYPLPDRLFLKLDWSIWNGETVLSGGEGETANHQELRLGAGINLLPFTISAFRLLGGTGFSMTFANSGFNLLADPLWLGMEYHFSRWAIQGEVRFPLVLGYGRNAFSEDQINSGIIFSVGVMLKW